MAAPYEIVVFDLDGTLLDSDAALVDSFVRLGVPRHKISFGHPIEVECRRLGLRVEDYVDAYDEAVAQPFTGVGEMLEGIPRWAICSNKHPVSGHAELARLGWGPEVVTFSDVFGGRPKRVEPALELAGVAPDRALFVGDTAHDRECAASAGVEFGWAAWNPRTAASAMGEGRVFHHPADVVAAASGLR